METLLLLHGAIGASDQLQALEAELKNQYNVHAINFSGHGKNTSYASGFSIGLFAKDVLRFCDEKNLQKISIFGYSMGGYVAMYLAKHHPERINKLVTFATKYHWNEEIAAREVKMLDPEKIQQKVPAFAEALQQRHTSDWKDVLYKSAAMMLDMGMDNVLKTEDYPGISIPVLLMLGDRDKMVTLDETLTVYKALPNAQLAVLPNTPHPIEQVDHTMLSACIKRYI